ncbi:MAG: S-methyl-5-thioribose-1-phosphate isomerase, partial [Verrucomicrobiota bacterium]
MNVHGKHYRTIWIKEDDARVVQIIDQRFLPHEFVIEDLQTVDEVAAAIRDMHVRGAGLIGATAGYGIYIAAMEAVEHVDFNQALSEAAERLKATRPTAVNLAWAVDRQLKQIAEGQSVSDKIAIAFATAIQIADEDAGFCKKLGQHGLKLIRRISKRKGGAPVNVLTHCNAGW